MNAPAVSIEVFQRFHALRRRHLFVRLGIAFTMAAAVLVAMWVALATSDYYWEWPLAWRKVGWTAGIAFVAVPLVHRVYRIIRETRQRRFAGQLERSFDEFGQRIRTVLDTVEGRVSGPAAMLSALGHQTLGRWETTSPSRIIPVRSLMVCGGTCLLAIALAAGLFHSGQDWRSAMLRALGSEVPYTSMTIAPGDTTILEGLPVEVSLILEGRINRAVKLRYRNLSDAAANESTSDDAEVQWMESELLPESLGCVEARSPRSARFSFGLGVAATPIEYQFVTNVGTSDVFRIDVQPLIDALRTEATVEPPQYTKLNTRSFSSTDITVLEQSKVIVTVETNHPLREATLKLGEKPAKLTPVEIVPGEDRTIWKFELPSNDSLHWSFSGSGLDGTPMAPINGRLRVRRDAAPTVAWRDPPDEIRVHTLAELPMRLQVSDDYGISEAAIVFQLGGDDEYVLTDWIAERSADESDTTTTRARLEEILPLESFSLSERDYISYYAYAVDNCTPRARRTETDVRYIDIRPLRQFFSEVERDPNAQPGGSGVLIQLDEIIRRQRFLVNRTRKLVHGSGGDLANPLGVIDRMVEGQSELSGLTRFLAEFFVARGNDDVEALNQAEAAMLQAADSLAAFRFDLALAQEEDALRALAEARRTIEIFLLKNNSSDQRRATQQFVRQLRQKLRRDRPENEQEIADTLMQIAAQQLRLGEDAARFSSGPSTDGDSAEVDTTGDSDAPNVKEHRDELFSGEVELIERLHAIEDQLPRRLAGSDLMRRRMENAASAMDSLATAARVGDFGEFSSQSRDVSEQLRELGVHLESVAETEAVMRVSAIRDMTTSLANMESELADELRESSSTAQSATDDPERAGDGIERLARRMQRRAETVDDVLMAPVEIGDVVTSEVHERLQAFAEENDFLDQLEATRQASEELLTDASTTPENSGQRAYDRAVEYADAAYQLDDLYRQMVTPRLERLREMEARANSLAQRMGNSGKADEEAADPKTKAGLGRLRQDLEEVGLRELAELLDADAVVDGPPGGTVASELRVSDGRFAPMSSSNLRGRAFLVVRELRARIQEMILVEISADRDAPVPPQYRAAVDQYLRVIAGEAERSESDAISAESTDGGSGL